MQQPVTVTINDAIASVHFDNPPVNAMSRVVMKLLGEVAEALATNASVRVILLTAEGTKAFLAGAEINEFGEILKANEMASHTKRACAVMEKWASMPQPVISCVRAPAVGGGFELALAGDVIIASGRASFGLPEVKLGIIPAGGGTQRLVERVGVYKARRLIMTGETVQADEAYRLGIVDELVDDNKCFEVAQQLAGRLANLPRLAVQAGKSATIRDMAEGLARERALFLSLTRSVDFVEGANAFLEGRRPRFVHH